MLDFLDGVVFAPDEIYLTLGRFVDERPYASDYTFENIYYRSIRERETDYLTVRDYLWRWDTDWFWCSKNVGAQHPLVRRLLGRERLNSITYQRIMRWNSRWGVTRALDRLRGWHSESVIQDVDIPLDRAAEFLDFLQREIGILPIWICPIRAPAGRCALRALSAARRTRLYVNFGFWDVVRDREPHPPGYRNRLIERKVTRVGRPQVALFGLVLHEGRVLEHLRSRGLLSAEGALRSCGHAARPVRQVRAAAVIGEAWNRKFLHHEAHERHQEERRRMDLCFVIFVLFVVP